MNNSLLTVSLFCDWLLKDKKSFSVNCLQCSMASSKYRRGMSQIIFLILLKYRCMHINQCQHTFVSQVFYMEVDQKPEEGYTCWKSDCFFKFSLILHLDVSPISIEFQKLKIMFSERKGFQDHTIYTRHGRWNFLSRSNLKHYLYSCYQYCIFEGRCLFILSVFQTKHSKFFSIPFPKKLKP